MSMHAKNSSEHLRWMDDSVGFDIGPRSAVADDLTLGLSEAASRNPEPGGLE